MNYAVVESGGKQYKVEKGSTIEVDNLNMKADEAYYFDKVLLYVGSEGAKIGKPYVEGLAVKAKVLESVKSDKIRVAKFKSKVRYRRVYGFRGLLTRLLIEDINVKSKVKN